MFYLEDYLTVKKGEEIFGSIAVRPNEKNVVRFKRSKHKIVPDSAGLQPDPSQIVSSLDLNWCLCLIFGKYVYSLLEER